MSDTSLRRVATATVAVAVLAASASPAASAAAGSLTFVRGGSVWISQPDGSGQRRVTATGLSAPSESVGGVLLALGSDKRMYRFDQYGRLLAPPIDTSATAPNPHFYGPYDPVISPNGLYQAYWLGSKIYDPTCNCVDLQDFTRWGSASSFNEPQSQGEGQGDYSLPQWIDNSNLLLSSNGSSPLIAQVGVYHVGDAANSVTEWFSDNAANQVGAVAMAPTHDKLAVVEQTAAGPKLVLYKMNGAPPAPPTAACQITNPAGGAFDHPAFSPDGTQMAWHEGDGIHSGTVGDLSNCAGIQTRLVVPGATAPFWSAAALSPPPCVVPRLAGQTLGAARRSLAAARCALGSVQRRGTPRGGGHVVGQHPSPRTVLSPGSKVSLTLG